LSAISIQESQSRGSNYAKANGDKRRADARSTERAKSAFYHSPDRRLGNLQPEPDTDQARPRVSHNQKGGHFAPSHQLQRAIAGRDLHLEAQQEISQLVG
jgi:hypothetical protein